MKISFRPTKEKILVIDLGNLFYYAKPSHLNEELLQGRYSIVEQFIINLNSYIWKIKPTSVVIADDSSPEWRKSIYPLYKSNRKESDEPEELKKSYYANRIKLERVIKEYLPVYYFKIDNLEADDICYLIANKFKTKDIVIMSGDKDLLQISQKFYNTQIFDPIRKGIVGDDGIDIVRYKILKGDTSDNIKGFVGIGDKKARVILQNKKTFNAWYKTLTEEELKLYKDLKSIICLSKIPEELKNNFEKEFAKYEFKEFDKEKFEQFVNEIEFDRINLKYVTENLSNLKKI